MIELVSGAEWSECVSELAIEWSGVVRSGVRVLLSERVSGAEWSE